MNLKIVRGINYSSNSFLLKSETNEKLLIIDLGFLGNQTSYQLREKILEITGKNRDLEIEVFLTHCHLDHIMGYDNLKEYTNITFSSSAKTAQHVNDKDNVTLLGKFGIVGDIDYKISKIYQNGDILQVSQSNLEVIYAPGHTDGCAVLYDRESKALFAGDVVFAGGASGRVDLPTGNCITLINTLEKLAKLDILHLYSGHGEDLHKNVRKNILAAKDMLEYNYF